MNLTLNTQGKAGKTIEVAEAIFGADYNESLIHQTVTAFLAGGRSGTKAQKSRSEVSGGGIKPWRQKGTGRARAGSIRSPIWRGGGKSFAAKPRKFAQKINRKMYRAAMRSILSELIRQDRLIVVENIDVDVPKTKQMLSYLAPYEFNDGLIVLSELNQNVLLSARNIPHIKVTLAQHLDPVSLIAHNKVLMTQDALKAIEESLA